jgi:hypothetical protein
LPGPGKTGRKEQRDRERNEPHENLLEEDSTRRRQRFFDVFRNVERFRDPVAFDGRVALDAPALRVVRGLREAGGPKGFFNRGGLGIASRTSFAIAEMRLELRCV